MKEFEVTLQTGQSELVKFSAFKYIKLLYSGMPNPDTFAVSVVYPASYSAVVYFSIDAKDIFLENYEASVISVSAQSITLTIRG